MAGAPKHSSPTFSIYREKKLANLTYIITYTLYKSSVWEYTERAV